MLRDSRQHPFRAADADPHGPDYSTDHRVSSVAVRFRWSMPLLWSQQRRWFLRCHGLRAILATATLLHRASLCRVSRGVLRKVSFP